MTREERKLSIEYLEGIKDNYIDGYGYERHPLPEYYAIQNAIKALEHEPTTKNDLGVDCISRAEVKKIAKEMYLEVANMELDVNTISDCISYTSSKCREVLERKLRDLPPVPPQEPILDKIRAEIIEMTSNRGFLSCSVDHIHEEINAVFDKYKVGSEENE